MSPSEALGLEETLARLAAYAERHHNLAKGVVLQFHELVKAVEPLMLACGSTDALLAFREDLTRINDEVTRLIKAAEEEGMS